MTTRHSECLVRFRAPLLAAIAKGVRRERVHWQAESELFAICDDIRSGQGDLGLMLAPIIGVL